MYCQLPAGGRFADPRFCEVFLKEIRIISASTFFDMYIYELKMLTSKMNEEGEPSKQKNWFLIFCACKVIR
jgi:hypothetical protein